MDYNLPESCPVCKGEIVITSIKCKRCESELKGIFRSCDFCSLNSEQARLVKVFLASRGSIKEVEKELGISYPTVRARIAEILAVLGISEAGEGEAAPESSDVLRKLESGEITAGEAADLLRGRKQSGGGHGTRG